MAANSRNRKKVKSSANLGKAKPSSSSQVLPSPVAYVSVRGYEQENVFSAVEQAMELAHWKKYVRGKKIFIKPNLLSDQVVPGQCTSPWVLEAVIKIIKTLGSGVQISVGDADVATSKQVEPAARNWGVMDICKRQGVKFINLSKEKTVNVKMDGVIFKNMPIPKILVDADTIVTVPVVKTHNVTTMTCSLKNQWGCIPTFRHQYHLVADKCISDINSFLKVKFAVADATICLEENGPRVGRPKFVGAVMASNDRVAMDSAACKIIGVNPMAVAHVKEAGLRGLGSNDYSIVGDTKLFWSRRFKPALLKNHPIVMIELFLRKIPGIRWIVFNTPLFKIPAWIASKYNSFWWYNREGKGFARDLIRKNALARNEFEPLLQRIGKL
ncbi:DUF362 domain-containing protein [Candidatus Woesearchaeota archaeon]|nr:DUF362 domain-containing protein [Candidatus Woesearchaeota archaeon]